MANLSTKKALYATLLLVVDFSCLQSSHDRETAELLVYSFSSAASAIPIDVGVY